MTPLSPLPAPPAAAPPSSAVGAGPGALDWALLLLVAVCAFLLASFPARNGDLWQHLVGGRRLAQGEFFPGHTWLFDLAVYALYSAFGGVGLVFVKALLVVGLAGVLFRLGRGGRGWAITAACTALALLAMSTRLLVQPALVSCLLLALTLWALWEGESKRPAPSVPPLLPPWPLVVLFVLWANLDSWFVLGLGTVALAWLGRTAAEASAAGSDVAWPRALLRRGAALAVLAAACLLNPLHVHAFAWPPELGTSAFSFTAAGARSPFQAAYFAHFGPTPAVLAYFPLLALGLLSFLPLRQRLPWGRLLPWLGLALLSAFQAKAIPLFAVVAGPVLALNIQDALGQRTEVFRGGRGLALLGAVVLAVCAWPGWLQGPPFEPRRWAVELDPSLEAGATIVRQWHRDGKVGPEARGLHLSVESLHAFAWFCPEDRGVFDEELAGAVRGDREMAPDRWAERMRALGIDHIVVYDADPARRFVTSSRLLSDPESLPLLALEGHLAVFGWRDPGAAEQFRGREFAADRRAFHSGDIQRAPKGSGGAEGRRWWEAFWKPVPRSLDHETAPMLLTYAEALRQAAPPRHMTAWDASRTASYVGAAAGWSGPGGVYDATMRMIRLQPRLPGPGKPLEALPVPDRLALQEQREFTVGRDDAPPALLYLAVRAARRAIAADPDDAKAYLALGESYLRLILSTRERAWARDLPELAQLRRAQASAALNRAVTLNPDLAQAHLSLVGLYREMGYLDLALEHLQTYLRLARIAGPPPGADPERYQAQEKRFEDEVKALARQVDDAQNSLSAAAAGTALKERAQVAVRKGLAGRARDMLLASDISEFGPDGMTLELQLQLGTGHAREVWDWTGPEQEGQLGPEAVPAYHWIRARALAASGEYELARQACEDVAQALLVRERGEAPTRPRELLALVATQTVLANQPGGRVWGLPAPFDILRADFGQHTAALARTLRQEADTNVLRGLLALEEGDVEEAAVAFRTALQLWRNEEDPSVLGMDFAGRTVAQACLEWMGE